MVTFPINSNDKNEKTSHLVSNSLFGNRFHSDQSLYEYLIEFLQIFVSAKSKDDTKLDGEMRFHNENDELIYHVSKNMGLRRFIFYNASKKDKSIPLDEEAYNLLIDELKKNIDTDKQEQVISALQDLFRGYAVVLKKRTWCAQQILPICPELVFCEAMPNQAKRKANTHYSTSIKMDTEFEFAQRNFLARGGEVYYLHLLQALRNDCDTARKERLEQLLTSLLVERSSNISKIANVIKNTWENLIVQSDSDKMNLYQKMSLSYIPASAYKECNDFAVDELINYLSSDFQQIKKIEILAKGIMFQIMRMMYCAVVEYLGINHKPWIVDMTGNTSMTIKRISSHSLQSVEDDFKQAINKKAQELGYEDDKLVSEIKKGQKESLDIFRSKGKELRCVIPVSGAYERFTLSEDVLRFLVLSIVKPKMKITYDMFLDELYEHYHIVVSAKQYDKAIKNPNSDHLSIKNCLYENEQYFQDFLKSTGFLKELSDSTSLVYNPYSEVE